MEFAHSLKRQVTVLALTLAAMHLVVSLGWSDALDLQLRIHLWQGHPYLDQVMKSTELVLDRYITLALLLSGALLTWKWRGRELGRRASLAVAIAWATNLGLTTVLKLGTGRGRARLGQLRMYDWRHVELVDLTHTRLMASYPSGHSGGAALAAMTTWYLSSMWAARPRRIARSLGIVAIVATCALSWLRTTHWVTDLVAGALVGWLTAAVGCAWAFNRKRSISTDVSEKRPSDSRFGTVTDEPPLVIPSN